jgi:hypothetical protein
MDEQSNGTKKFLSIDEVNTAKDEEYFEIEVWGGIFLAGSLTADDFIEWQEANEGPAKRTAGLRLIVDSMCGSLSGCPACSGTDGALHKGLHPRTGNDKHLEIYKKKSVAQTEKVVGAIVKLNGLKTKGSETKND